MRALLPVVLLWPALALADHELDDRDIGNGQVLYKEHCASCHGFRLEGQPNWRRPGEGGILPAPPHDATGHTCTTTTGFCSTTPGSAASA